MAQHAYHDPTESTRAYILRQAEALLGTRGYRGFSMRELAKACGLAKASLYHYFPSKRELYRQVVEAQALALQRVLENAASQPGSIPERIGFVAQAYFDYLVEKQHLFDIALRDGGNIDDIKQVFITHQAGIAAPLVALMEAGQAAGILRTIDSPLMARALIGMITAQVRHLLLTKGATTSTSVVEDTVSLFLEGAIVRS